MHLPLISFRSVHMSPESDAGDSLQREVLRHTEDLFDSYAYGVKGATRYFFRRGHLERLLEERFPSVETVTTDVSFFNRLGITVKKRFILGTACADRGCFLIDTNGIVFRETDVPAGYTLIISDDLRIGDRIFREHARAGEYFGRIFPILSFLDGRGLFVEHVSLRKDSHIVHVRLKGGIAVWMDTGQRLYDTTRALYVVFEEVFPGLSERSRLKSVDVRDPLSILYETR